MKPGRDFVAKSCPAGRTYWPDQNDLTRKLVKRLSMTLFDDAGSRLRREVPPGRRDLLG
jgi:hypothetical protein